MVSDCFTSYSLTLSWLKTVMCGLGRWKKVKVLVSQRGEVGYRARVGMAACLWFQPLQAENRESARWLARQTIDELRVQCHALHQ